MLFIYFSTQISLPHVLKMSAFITYTCFKWCSSLVNGCVDCVTFKLFNTVLNIYLHN